MWSSAKLTLRSCTVVKWLRASVLVWGGQLEIKVIHKSDISMSPFVSSRRGLQHGLDFNTVCFIGFCRECLFLCDPVWSRCYMFLNRVAIFLVFLLFCLCVCVGLARSHRREATVRTLSAAVRPIRICLHTTQLERRWYETHRDKQACKRLANSAPDLSPFLYLPPKITITSPSAELYMNASTSTPDVHNTCISAHEKIAQLLFNDA